MKAVYPGSFDPTTYGHLDIIRRAASFTDELTVAVLNNSAKQPFFTVEERIEHLKQLTAAYGNVKVKSFSGLLVDFADSCGANIIVRGLRAVTDYEYEFQMALTNRSLNNKIETLFMPSSTQYQYLSSGLVKEVAKLGGNPVDMVPGLIIKALKDKIVN
jgi:pantetheine-phosphate adenylyltransferase